MRIIVSIVVWSVLLVSAAWRFGWTDRYHLVWGISWIAALLAFLLLWRNWKAAGADEDEPVQPPLLRVLLGTSLKAIFVITLIAGGFWALDALGFAAPDKTPVDVDRAEFEEKINFAVRARGYAVANELIERRLGEPISKQWKESLVQLWYRNLIEQGKDAPSRTDRRKVFAQAQELAKRFGLDPSLAVLLDEKAREEEAFLQRVEGLRKDKNWQDLTKLLEAKLPENCSAMPREVMARQLRDAYLFWGDQITDNDQKYFKYFAAFLVARRHGLEVELAAFAKELTEKRTELDLDKLILGSMIRSTDPKTPRDLQAGATGGLIRVNSDFAPPLGFVDVWLENADGTFCDGLLGSDFRAVDRWGKASCPIYASSETKAAVPLHQALVLDRSGSTEGERLETSLKGAKHFLSSLEADKVRRDTSVTVIAFDTDVEVLCPATNNFEKASASLAGVRAKGDTAIFKALDKALHELKGKSGDKCVLLFTDGQDTIGGADVKALVQGLQKEKIVVSIIGLGPADVDAKVMQFITQSTGGQYSEADKLDQLVARYREAASRARGNFYRVWLEVQDSDFGTMKLLIGSKNQIVLPLPKPQPRQPIAYSKQFLSFPIISLGVKNSENLEDVRFLTTSGPAITPVTNDGSNLRFAKVFRQIAAQGEVTLLGLSELGQR